jgi:LysR family transcriptional regulator, regulator of abg operon
MNMDHRQLQLFLAVAERLNLSQAAEAMGITQPGLSKSMHRLHRALGTRLYHRRGRGIELTEAGRALVRHAKLVETQLADARAEVVGIADGKWGHARIGAGPSWLSRHLPVTISRIMNRYPNIRFTVDTGFPDKLVGRLRLGELDIVIGALPENRIDPDLRFLRLTSDVIRVVGRKDHPLTKKRDRTLSDFAAQRWVLPGRQELVRQRLARALIKAGFPEPTPAIESDSLSLILATLRTTDCLGLTTTQILLEKEAHGVVAIDHEALRFRREAGIISRRHADLSPSVRLVIAELRQIAARHGSN